MIATGCTAAYLFVRPSRGISGNLQNSLNYMEVKVKNGRVNVHFSGKLFLEQCLIFAGAAVLVFEFLWFGAEQQFIIP